MNYFIKSSIILSCAAVAQLASAAPKVYLNVTNQSAHNIVAVACVDKQTELCEKTHIPLGPQQSASVISFVLANNAAFNHTITLRDSNQFKYCDVHITGRTELLKYPNKYVRPPLPSYRFVTRVADLGYDITNVEYNVFTCSNVTVKRELFDNGMTNADESLHFNVTVTNASF